MKYFEVNYNCWCRKDNDLINGECIPVEQEELRNRCLGENQQQTPEWECSLNEDTRDCCCLNKNSGNIYKAFLVIKTRSCSRKGTI